MSVAEFPPDDAVLRIIAQIEKAIPRYNLFDLWCWLIWYNYDHPSIGPDWLIDWLEHNRQHWSET